MRTKAERKRLRRTNAERAANGLPPLTPPSRKPPAIAEKAPEPECVGPIERPGKPLETSGKGAVVRYRNLSGVHPLDLAFERCKITEEQHEAGTVYRGICETVARSGIDSTRMIDRSRSSETDAWHAQSRADAIRRKEAIETDMGRQDVRICERFCGEGRNATDAVRGDFRLYMPDNAIMDRLREALDALALALRTCHKKRA